LFLKAIFLSPWMLAGLIAAAIPLIIEWLFRRRKRQIELPTIRFLLDNKEQERIRRQDRILLLLRTVAIVLLVLAVARPVIRHEWVGAKTRRDVVLLIDGTASMRQLAGTQSSFREAIDKAAKAVAALPKDGASVSAVYLGEDAETVIEAAADLAYARGKVRALRPSSGDTPLCRGLMEVQRLLERNRLENAELYIFSDLQRHTWNEPWSRPGGRTTVHPAEVLSQLADKCKIHAVDVGGMAGFNYFVSELYPTEWVLSADTPVQFVVTVRAVGEVPADARPAKVKFIVNDDVVKTLDNVRPTPEGVSLSFDYRFAPPQPNAEGELPAFQEYLVEAEVSGDSHHADNRRFYLCNVPAAVRVLILDETAEKDEADRDSLFLARAVVPPTHPGVAKLSHFAADVIHPSQLARVNIDDYAVVAMAGIDLQDASTVGKLERYVSDGGALWVFLGPRVNLHDYNKLLFKDGRGLLPARLPEASPTTAPAGPASAEAAVFPRFGMARHPALAALTDHGGSEEAAFRRFVPLGDPGGKVVLELSDGTPAIVEKTFGAGRVLLTNTTVSGEWTYLPALSEFTVMVQELLRHLVGRPDRAVNLTVGDPFVQPVYISDQHLMVRLPDDSRQEAPPMPGEHKNSYALRFSKTSQEGLYEVENAAGFLPRTRFVVNQGPGGSKEGDLARLDPDELGRTFGRSRLKWVSRGSRIEDVVAQEDTELAAAVFWTLVGLLAAESLLAWRFGRRRGEVPQ